jgi:formylglycine-generating enzyme required for sulfatase activity
MEPNPISTQALPAGTRIEEFVIERVLGSGGFGITYLARDVRLGRQVVIKENLPVQFCFRDPGTMSVSPRHATGEDAENFRWSLENFSKEAAILASLDHPGIVKVLRSFQAFGTSYFTMPFVEGVALDELVVSRKAKGEAFSETELRKILELILDALAHLHKCGIYHRDIKPSNILITEDGRPVLIDFGSARQRLSERSMTVVESAGYTPFEQLQSRGNVGPWSDLYALGGTLCKVITGEAPPKAMDRMRNDPFVPLSDRSDLLRIYSSGFLRSIDKSLNVKEGSRWQNPSAWRASLGCVSIPGKTISPKSVKSVNNTRLLALKPSVSKKRTAFKLLFVFFITLIGVSGLRELSFSSSISSSMSRIEGEGNRAGEERWINITDGVKLLMCWVPSGVMEVGKESLKNRKLSLIDQGFWLGKYEITQNQWRAVVGHNPSAFFQRWGNYPVESISWRDVCGNDERSTGFLGKINKSAPAGWKFDVPSALEWEYACRAGTNTTLNSGQDITSHYDRCVELEKIGWYSKNSWNRTNAVGKKKANLWGFFDMHGNVRELLADGNFAGGSWHSDPIYSTSDSKGDYVEKERSNTVGVRICLRKLDVENNSTPRIYTDIQLIKGIPESDIRPGDLLEISLDSMVKMTFCWVPAGEFIMGSPSDEAGRNNDEFQHRVKISHGFWMSETEVTQAQWQAAHGADILERPPKSSNGDTVYSWEDFQKQNLSSKDFLGKSLPMERMDWDEAHDWCIGLDEQLRNARKISSSWTISLPTEAEWEYACRAGTLSKYSGYLDDVAWHGGGYYGGNSEQMTHSVGETKTNAWGLYDMHGNVMEWCSDWYGDYQRIAVSDPIGPEIGSYHVARGGSFARDKEEKGCRSASRRVHYPLERSVFIGFRPVLRNVYR